MLRVEYVSGATGKSYQLDGFNAYIGHGGGLRSHEWTRELLAHEVVDTALVAREVGVGVTATHEAMDELRTALGIDVAARKPGMIVIDGKLRQRCLMVAADEAEPLPQWVRQTFTFAMLDGYWWREVYKEYQVAIAEYITDYPHDHPHDLGYRGGRGIITVGGILPALPRITFRGPCTNPYAIIGGNRYECDISVPTGSNVVIDATKSTPTVMLYDSFGNASNQFASAVRDGGRGGGSYAFEPLQVGAQEVTWSGDFGMQVAWHERETEPPWSR